jgi:hypothetical protein
MDLQADQAVMERVLGEAIVIEPANRPTAAAIVAMIPKSWGTTEACDDYHVGASRLLVATVKLGVRETRVCEAGAMRESVVRRVSRGRKAWPWNAPSGRSTGQRIVKSLDLFDESMASGFLRMWG